MEHNTKEAFFAKLALLGAALIWGSSFVLMKTTVDAMDPCYLLASRFSIGCILLGIIFYKKLRLLTKQYLWQGAVLGFFLFSGYCVQTYGLAETTPGKNAFLTTTYCVIVPFLYWIVDKNKPDIYNIAAAILCVGGIGFVSLSGGFLIERGDFLSICCGFLYAAHLVFISKYNHSKDAILLTILQFGFAAIYALIAALLFESPPTTFTIDTIKAILYLAIFATAIALCLQNIGQKYTHPAAASIILSLESVFGILFSILLYGEKLTGRLVVGFALIFISVILSETKLSFLRRFKKEAIYR
ncbi:MAG: DMT family transporter [Velocimicrobium sp.]